MKFVPEELIPIVSELTDLYTKGESTSITYERANQLMRAVLYCIEESEKPCQGTELPVIPYSTASEAYQAGYQRVISRTKETGAKYNELISCFKDYGNLAYFETVVRELPVFFKKYDARFAPQEHFLTLDYPVLKSFGNSCGIDLIAEYIDCIALEQEFLLRIPDSCVIDILNRWRGDYTELFINIAGFTVRNLLAAMMIGKKRNSKTDRIFLRDMVFDESAETLSKRFVHELQRLISEQYGCNVDLFRYLSVDIPGFAMDLKNAAENDCMDAVLAF